MSAGPGAPAFSPRVVLGLILVGVACLVALTSLSAYAPELRSGDDGGDHALSRSATGFAAASRLLTATGRRVIASRRAVEDIDTGLLILTPAARHGRAAVQPLTETTGTVLLVLPKWRTAPDPRDPGWVQVQGVVDERQMKSVLPDGLTVKRRPGVQRVDIFRPGGESFEGGLRPVESLQTVSGPGWVPVFLDARGEPLMVMNARSRLYVLADPDLLNTRGLADPATARAALRMIDLIWKGEGVFFDVTLHGLSRSRSVLRAVL
ncbi:MAG TPA: DUF4350 domain-containing protein, partial [Caulobacteraceae bacterium]